MIKSRASSCFSCMSVARIHLFLGLASLSVLFFWVCSGTTPSSHVLFVPMGGYCFAHFYY